MKHQILYKFEANVNNFRENSVKKSQFLEKFEEIFKTLDKIRIILLKNSTNKCQL